MGGGPTVNLLRWDFHGSLFTRHLGPLVLEFFQLRKVTRNISEAAEKASQWLWMKKGDRLCSVLLGHKLGTDHPWLCRPGEGV